jgi:hypothetical protein
VGRTVWGTASISSTNMIANELSPPTSTRLAQSRCHGALYASSASVMNTAYASVISTGCQLNSASVPPSDARVLETPPSPCTQVLTSSSAQAPAARATMATAAALPGVARVWYAGAAPDMPDIMEFLSPFRR